MHKNNKIEEFKIEGYNNGSVSTMVLDVFGDHAMFLKNDYESFFVVRCTFYTSLYLRLCVQ